ncbi:MAG TPA: alanine--glyoxylate aminotransferase family protein [Victivallales bacterium]|nr:alanine--glyoxylate aminotransferase family protein [Victivallales bacterium]
MSSLLVMTPGPTEVHEDVLNAMAERATNPDLDLAFYEKYKGTVDKFKKIVRTKNTSYILGGEGILGLEAACASLIEHGDRVLCIANGIFGEGFADFAKMFGAEVEVFKGENDKGINVDDLKTFLKKDSDFKLATVVHCETPSGIVNAIQPICKLLADKNIISVVDAVSSMGGEHIDADKWNIDILLGGSQKCFSAPVGLAPLSISNKALKVIESRKTSIVGYYNNLKVWKTWYEDKWFPYSQLINNIVAFDKALDRCLEKDFVTIHKKYAGAIRQTFINCGFKLFPKSHFSNTVTAVKMPEGINFKTLFDNLKAEGVLIGGGFDFLKDKIFRIGHMGENCDLEKFRFLFKAMDKVFTENNIKLKVSILKEFEKLIAG